MYKIQHQTHEELLKLCKTLKLGRSVCGNLDQFISDLTEQNATPREAITTLLKLVCDERDENKRRMLATMACLPSEASLDNFDFSSCPAIEIQMRELAECRFVELNQNIVFQGEPGLGKTHLACALGREAIKKGYSTLFVTANELLSMLDKARHENQLEERVKKLNRNKVLIIDEVGYQTQNIADGEIPMYCLINARYKTSSTIITTNRKLVELPMIWGKDYTTGQAVVDRIMGNTKLIKMTGKSYRLNGLQMIELNMNNS